MWSPSEATNLHPSGRAMTEFQAAAEAWDIGESFAGDAFSDDGNSLSPSDGPCPTDVGRTTALFFRRDIAELDVLRDTRR